MAQTFRESMRSLMVQSWQMVRRYGLTMAEAMRKSWAILKLKKQMKAGIIKFAYEKVDGTIRTAWGTLKEDPIPQTSGNDNRKKNDTIFVYFDKEKDGFRCFKLINFIRITK